MNDEHRSVLYEHVKECLGVNGHVALRSLKADHDALATKARTAEARIAELEKREGMLKAEHWHLLNGLEVIFNAKADGEWAKRTAGEALTKAHNAAVAATTPKTEGADDAR